MKRVLFAALVITALLLSLAGTVAAAPPADNPGKGPPELDKIVFIHYAKDFAPGKPEGTPGKSPGGKNEENGEDPIDYYKLLRLELTGTAEYYVNPNVHLVTEGEPIDAIIAGFEAWDAVTAAFDNTGGLFEYAAAPPPGVTVEYGIVGNKQNTISWGDLQEGIVAMACIWYIPGKPPRDIVEFDVVFNTFYDWGIDPDGEGPLVIDAFDIQNIATHEAGHPVGLADLYDDIYWMLTMYGYGSEGETIKCSLESGDILGAQKLYGTP